ncbi:MAG: hypothetical protein KAX44_02745 [Candidatus Brocadiae bacterium]|nr:hypothetical protein [Candidatus Brocadiia bacterium]
MRSLRLEQLEPRWLLSSVLDLDPLTAAPESLTFTDAQGDVITLELEGTAGRATVTADDSVVVNAGDVDNGEEITDIDITGATSDFQFAVSVDSSGLGADGRVVLGEVTANSVISGLFTIEDVTSVPASVFEIESFIGVSFSAGGGLNVHVVSGDGAGNGVVLTRGLRSGTVINVENDFTGDVTIGRVFAGAFNVGGTVNPGQWTVPAVSRSGFLGVGGDFDADVTVRGSFAGVATIADDASGSWIITGNLAAGGVMQAREWDDLQINGHLLGQIAAVNDLADTDGDGITLDVGGVMGRQARVISNDEITLDIGSSVLPGALASSDGYLEATVGGGFRGEFYAYYEVAVDVGGSMRGAHLESASYITATIGGGVVASQLLAGDDLSVTLGGSISGSILFSADDDINLDVGGNVSASRLITGQGVTGQIGGAVLNSVIEGSEDDICLDIAGNVVGSTITGGSEEVSAVIGGSVIRSTITSTESEVCLDITGNLISSRLIAGSEDVSVTVGGNVVGSRIEAATYVSMDVGGNMVRSSVYSDSGSACIDIDGSMVDSRVDSGSEEVTVTIGGHMIRSHVTTPISGASVEIDGNMVNSTIFAGDEVSVDIAGDLRNSTIGAGTSELILTVGGNMVASTASSTDDGATVDIAGHFLGSTIWAEEDSEVTIGGRFGSTIQIVDGNLTLDIGGDVAVGGAVSVSDDLIAEVDDLYGKFQADHMDLIVNGNVGPAAVIQANTVLDIDLDDIGFQVGGRFLGILDVSTAFDTGTGAQAVLVTGQVGRAAKFNIAGTFGTGTSATELAFGDDFLGQFILGTDLDVDLNFMGDATTVIIGGAVNADISVGGGLDFLSTGSLFDPTGALTGNFEDGVGAVTGTLTTVGGYDTVLPLEAVNDAAATPPFGQLDLSAGTALVSDNGTFEDADGDIITIRLQGTAGTVTLISDEAVTVNALVDDGETLTGIDITGASSDFLLVISVDSTTNLATDDGIVNLGEVTADSEILGVVTVADTTGVLTPASSFEMESFSGVGFARGGGLNIDDITGNASGEAVLLRRGLPDLRVINVSDDLYGIVSLPGTFGGTVNVGGDVGSGQWLLGPVARTGLLGAVTGDMGADVIVRGDFQGVATIGGAVDGRWQIQRGVGRSAALMAREWYDVRVGSNFAGVMSAVDSGISTTDGITVEIGGSLLPGGRIVSADHLVIDVGGDLRRGAVIGSDSDGVTADVGGSFFGELYSYSDVDLLVARNMVGGQVHSGSDLTVTVAGRMVGSRISAQSEITADVGGNVINSLLTGGDDDYGLTLAVGGSLIRSPVTTGGPLEATVAGNVVGSILAGSNDDSTVVISGNVIGSHILSGSSDISAEIGGHLLNSTVTSLESDVSLTVHGDMRDSLASAGEYNVYLTVGGSMINSRAEAASEIEVSVGGHMIRSTVFGDENYDVTLDVRGNMIDSQANSGSYSVTVAVGGNMLRSHGFSGESEVTLSVGGNMSGSNAIGDADVTVDVTGDVTRSTISAVNSDVSLSVGGDMVKSYAGAVDGVAEVTVGGHFRNSTVVAEEDVTLEVGGDFGSSAHVNDGDQTIVIGGSMLRGGSATAGQDLMVQVGRDLLGRVQGAEVDLDVRGDVGRSATIQAIQVRDLNSDDIGFHVGDDFHGRLNVAGSLRTGTGPAAVLVGGEVGGRAKLNIMGDLGGCGSAGTFVFNGRFAGELIVGGDVYSGLLFGDDVRQVVIGGMVNDRINVLGALDFLSTGNEFTATSATGGELTDGVGTVTGELVAADGYDDVLVTL